MKYVAKMNLGTVPNYVGGQEIPKEVVDSWNPMNVRSLIRLGWIEEVDEPAPRKKRSVKKRKSTKTSEV